MCVCVCEADKNTLSHSFQTRHTPTQRSHRPCRSEHPNHPHTEADMRSGGTSQTHTYAAHRSRRRPGHGHARHSHTQTHTHIQVERCCQRLFPVRRQTLTFHKWKWREVGRGEMHTLMRAHTHSHTHTHTLQIHPRITFAYRCIQSLQEKPANASVRSCTCQQKSIPVAPTNPLTTPPSQPFVFFHLYL